MSDAEKRYSEIGAALKGVTLGKMFGKLCLKLEGKAFAAFFENEMVFKLKEEDRQNAIALKGAKLFDPSGKGRPMKEWVQVPYTQQKKWQNLAGKAISYIKSQIE